MTSNFNFYIELALIQIDLIAVALAGVFGRAGGRLCTDQRNKTTAVRSFATKILPFRQPSATAWCFRWSQMQRRRFWQNGCNCFPLLPFTQKNVR
jgi:hypothetical protein